MGKRRTKETKPKDGSKGGKSSTPVATPKSQRLRSSTRRTNTPAATPLRIQSLIYDDGYLPLSQNGEACDVTWQSTSPITLTQATRDSKNKRKSKVHISELVKKFTQGASSPTATLTTSPLMGCWVTSQASSILARGRKKRGRPSGIKAAVNSRDILQKLTSVFDHKIEEEPGNDREEDTTPCAESHLNPQEEARITIPNPSVPEPAVFSNLSHPPLSPVPTDTPCALSYPSSVLHRDASKDNIKDNTPSAAIRKDHTPSRANRKQTLLSVTNTISPGTANQSCEELWTDEELFDDSLILQATQDMMDCAPEDTPKAPKRSRVAFSPKANRFTFSRQTSSITMNSTGMKPKTDTAITNPALSDNTNKATALGPQTVNHVTYKAPSVSSVRHLTRSHPSSALISKPIERHTAMSSAGRNVSRSCAPNTAPSVAKPTVSVATGGASVSASGPGARSLVCSKPQPPMTARPPIMSSSPLRRLQSEPLVPSSPGTAGLGDTSLSDDLLASLAAPDDLLDSQIISEEAWLDEGNCVEENTIDIVFEENNLVNRDMKNRPFNSEVEIQNKNNVPPPVAPQHGSTSKGTPEFFSDEDDNLDTDQLLALLDHAESSQSIAAESAEPNIVKGPITPAIPSVTGCQSTSLTAVAVPMHRTHSYSPPVSHYGGISTSAPAPAPAPACSKSTASNGLSSTRELRGPHQARHHAAMVTCPQISGSMAMSCSPPQVNSSPPTASCTMTEIERKRQAALRRRAKVTSPRKLNPVTTVSSACHSLVVTTGVTSGNKTHHTASHAPSGGPSPASSPQSSPKTSPVDIERKRLEALQRRLRAISPQKSREPQNNHEAAANSDTPAAVSRSLHPEPLNKNQATAVQGTTVQDMSIVCTKQTPAILPSSTSTTMDTTVSHQIELKKQEALKRRNSRLKLSTKNKK